MECGREGKERIGFFPVDLRRVCCNVLDWITDCSFCLSAAVKGHCIRRESVASADLHTSPLTGIEQNTRVLTLAEQIIAAIPDRIKVLFCLCRT